MEILMRTPLLCALMASFPAMAQDAAPRRPLDQAAPRMVLRSQNADQMMDRANFVFIGTVVQLQTSNLTSIAHGPQTTLVKVERVLHGTPITEDLVGQVITVRSEKASEHRLGQRSTFFLDVDAFGEHASGIEMGRFGHVLGDEEVHAKLLADTKVVREDRVLSQRMQRAEQVVHGRVVSVEPAGIEEPKSEHMANWRKATVEVQTVIKGQPSTKTVTFFFPSSRDEMWMDAPRFAVGQEGVWLLHPQPKDGSRKASMIPGLTALDPKDFQHRDQRQRLQRILANR